MKKEEKELIINLRDSAISGFNKVKKDFLELEKGYLALLDDDEIKSLKCRNKSHISQKKILAKVRRIGREILKTYFSNSTLAEVEVENRPELTAILQAELNNVSNKELNLYTTMQPLVENLLVYGTGIAKTYWSKEFNRPKVQVKAINEVLIDPNARSHFDAGYFVDRFYMSVADIKKNFKTTSKKIDFDAIGGGLGDSNLGDYRRVLVCEVYRKKDNKWFVSTLVEDEFLRGDVELKDSHPFDWGIAFSQFCRVDEEDAIRSYGASYIEPMIAIQKQFIATRNQQMDAIYKQLNPRIMVSRNAGLRDDDLLSNSAKIVVNDLGEIKELPLPNISQSIFDVEKLDEELQEVGGLPKFAQGIASKTDPKSATGVSLMQESGNATIDDIVTTFNESFFEPFVRRIVNLIYKYKISDKFKGVDRDEILKLNIKINAGMGVANKDMKINGIQSAKQSLLSMQNLAVQQGLAQKSYEYLNALDAITIEELKLLGMKNIESRIQEGISQDDIQRQMQSAQNIQGE